MEEKEKKKWEEGALVILPRFPRGFSLRFTKCYPRPRERRTASVSATLCFVAYILYVRLRNVFQRQVSSLVQ